MTTYLPLLLMALILMPLIKAYADSIDTNGGIWFYGSGGQLEAQISNSTISTSTFYGSGAGLTNLPPISKTFSLPSRALNTAFQISTTYDTDVTYGVDITVASALLGTATGLVALQYADNSGMTTNLVTLPGGQNSTAGVLNISNIGTVTVHGIIPAGKWVRIATTNTSGATFAIRSNQQEVLF